MPTTRKKSARASKRKTSKKKKAAAKTPAKSNAAPADAASFVILLDEPDEPTNVVKLRRDCNIEEIEGIRQRLLKALAEDSEMVVDLGNVRGVDCAFLQVLASLRLEAKAQEKTVSVKNGSAALLESAELLGLADQIT